MFPFKSYYLANFGVKYDLRKLFIQMRVHSLELMAKKKSLKVLFAHIKCVMLSYSALRQIIVPVDLTPVTD